MADPIKYKDIFKQDKTTANIKDKNAETRAKLLGNENLSQIMGRSMQLLNELAAAEKPYIPELEKLAVETVTNMYPIIKEAGITISAKLGAGGLPPKEKDKGEEEDKPEHIPFLDDEVAKRRLINAITQGASIQGALEKPFLDFLEEVPDGLLDGYSKVMNNLDNSVSKYGESLKKIFGIFYDEQAIAMMLAQLASANAPGKEMKGGESDVEVNEEGEVHIRATGLIFPILVHEIIKGLYELISLHGFTGDEETDANIAASDELSSEPEDMSVGTIIKDGLDELYRNAKIYNKVPFEMFLVNLYKTPAAEFNEFIEDLINSDLSAGQKVWAEDLMQPPQDEEQNDEDYELGINEDKQLEEGLKFYMESMGYLPITEGISDTIKKLKAKLTPKDKYFVKLLNALKDKLPAEGTSAIMSALQHVKDNPDLSAADIKSQLSGVNEADESNDSEKGLGPLRNFLNKSKVGKTLRNTMIGLVISALTVPLVQNAFSALSPKNIQQIATVQSVDDIQPDTSTSTISYNDANNVGVNLDGQSLDDMEGEQNTDIKVLPFEFADGNTLTPEGQQILDDYIANLELELGTGGVSGEVTIDPYGFASNTGANSEVSDEGGADLSTQRAETILKYLKSKLGDKVGDTTINYGEPQSGDYETQELENGEGDDGAVGVIKTKFDVTKTKQKTDPTKFYNEFHPLYDEGEEQKADINPVGLEEPTSGQEEEPTSDDINIADVPDEEPAVIQPGQIKQDVNSISKLNRNGQIAFILARISPKTNIFKAINKDTITSLSDNDLDKIKKGNTSQTAKVLAQLIPNLRKSPDQFLKRISALTGIELEPRAKAISTSPNSQAQTNQIAEQRSLKGLLLEAAIDDLFTKLGITPETVKQNRIEIAALAASMYASAANTNVSILDTSKLTPEEQKELGKFGFGFQQGKDYVFLQPGQTANSSQGSRDKNAAKSKTQSDVTRVDKSLDNKTSLKTDLSRINTRNELTQLVLGIMNLIDSNLTKDKGQMRNLMFGLRNRIQEETQEKDTSNVIKRIVDNPELKTLFSRINTAEEGIQLILRNIIPLLNKDFLAKKNEIRGAIIAATNIYTNALTQTKKQPMNESFLKMQKLAGVITESQYREMLNERVEVMNKRNDAEPDYQYRNIIKIQQYIDSNDDSEQYAQIIGFFIDDNDKIEKYHIRTFSTNDINSRTGLTEWTLEDFKRTKAVKIDDNDSDIINTIKKHPKYVKY